MKPNFSAQATQANLTARNALAARLVAARRHLGHVGEKGGWQTVGAACEISGGMAYRIALQGYDPADSGIRKRLGLPCYAPAPVCTCGSIHVSKRCSNRPRKPVAPRTDWKRLALAARWALVVLGARERRA